MICEIWDEGEYAEASRILGRRFPASIGVNRWSRSADTTRVWHGTVEGLWSSDTRLPIKNNAEYHGMERYGWQFLVTAQFLEARDHFYLAARWREIDLGVILGDNPGLFPDEGHLEAIAMCIRMARFCASLADVQLQGGVFPSPLAFGLDEKKVADREARAQRQIDVALGSR